MSITEQFLRHIDSVDGEIEVRAEPGLSFISCHFGAFSMAISHLDNRAVVAMVGQVLANPDENVGGVDLDTGDYLQCGAVIHRDDDGKVTEQSLWLSSSAVHARLQFATASLLIGALCEGYSWHQHQQLATAGQRVARC